MRETSETTTFQHADLRIDATDGRLLTGIAVPYETVTMKGPYPGGERFARGSFRRTIKNQAARMPKLFFNHDHSHAIGTVVEMRDTDAGVVASWRIADTPAGNAALQEVREGVLDALSVGFQAVREGAVGGVREVREARLLEVSLTPTPAYDGAVVLSVRSSRDPAAIVLPLAPDIDPDWVPRFGAHLW